MAAMITALTGDSINGSTITYTTSGHTFSAKRNVVQKRGATGNGQAVGKGEVATVWSGLLDAAGESLLPNLRLTAASSVPIGALEADIAAAIVIFRDYVASDEFNAAVRSGTKIADF